MPPRSWLGEISAKDRPRVDAGWGERIAPVLLGRRAGKEGKEAGEASGAELGRGEGREERGPSTPWLDEVLVGECQEEWGSQGGEERAGAGADGLGSLVGGGGDRSLAELRTLAPKDPAGKRRDKVSAVERQG